MADDADIPSNPADVADAVTDATNPAIADPFTVQPAADVLTSDQVVDSAATGAVSDDSAPEPGSADATADVATTEAEAAEPDAEPEPVAEPEGPLTAVGLGLLPETFVSTVSTALHFYAPPVALLPLLDDIDESPAPADAVQPGTSTSRRRNRRPARVARPPRSVSTPARLAPSS